MASPTDLMSTTRGLASDSQGLDALRRQAGRDPKTAAREAARQFESLFMQQMLKSMRDALPTSGLLDNSGTKLGTELLDSQLAASSASGDRTGSLADLIARQLERSMSLPPMPRSGSTGAGVSNAGSVNGAAALGNGEAPIGVPQKGALGFVQKHQVAARQIERSTGIPAAFMLGQAALETGWGGKEIIGRDGTNANNLFGIKAGRGWNGPTVDVMTTEYINGSAQKVVQRFRAYASAQESFADYARLISGNPRYAQAMQSTDDARGYAQGLQRGGYATDPRYADKLSKVIETASRLQQQLG